MTLEKLKLQFLQVKQSFIVTKAEMVLICRICAVSKDKRHTCLHTWLILYHTAQSAMANHCLKTFDHL